MITARALAARATVILSFLYRGTPPILGVNAVLDPLMGLSIFAIDRIGMPTEPTADRFGIEVERIVPVRIQVDWFCV